MTKKNLIAALTAANIAVPAKANVVTLTALCEQHGLTTSPSMPAALEQACANLGIETETEQEQEQEQEQATPPLPVVEKPTQVAVGLVIEKDRPTQNGITRPSAGGRCRAVWDALDAYKRETGDQPDAKVVRALAADEGWNPNNASIEFYQWRKFNGVTGRVAKPAAAAAE